ncbi:unnamed protein product [Effrenium voratum]|nr:unnamed protein product [Effrenium voratum]
MERCSVRPSAVTFTALLKGYARSGQVEAAATLHRMAAKGLSLDVVAWTAMLGACAERWDVALCALRQMRQLQVLPNQDTDWVQT